MKEGDAPTVREGVGEADKALLEERVVLPVFEGLAPRVKDAVGVAVLVLMPLGETGSGGETVGKLGVEIGLPELVEAALLPEGSGGGEKVPMALEPEGGVLALKLVAEG